MRRMQRKGQTEKKTQDKEPVWLSVVIRRVRSIGGGVSVFFRYAALSHLSTFVCPEKKG